MLSLHHLYKKSHQKFLRIKLSHRQHVIIDACAFGAGIAGPIMTIPQLYTIFVVHNIVGVSLITWGSFAFLSLIWLAYGTIHRQKAIFVSSLAGFLTNMLVVVGVIFPHI